MKKVIILVTGIVILTFLSFKKNEKASHNNLCDIINSSPNNKINNFDLNYLFKIKKNKLLKIDNKIYKFLFDNNPSTFDGAYIISQFSVSKNRRALIILNYFPECDSEKKEIRLFIIENCKKVIADYQISYVDNEGTIYEVTSRLNRKNKLLKIKIDTSSEWSSENQPKIDTIFTECNLIKLSSIKLDTIQKVHYYNLKKTCK
jgi:hypothetical protein